MNIDTSAIEQAVINKAVEALVEQFSDPNHDISQSIHDKVRALIEMRVNEEIDRSIREIVDGGLEKIVFPQTNHYGEAQKSPQSLREFIGATTQAVFTEYLNNEGKPTTDSWYAKPENQRVNRLIKQAIEEKIGKDVIEAAKSLQSQIHCALGTYVKVSLDEAMAKLRK